MKSSRHLAPLALLTVATLLAGCGGSESSVGDGAGTPVGDDIGQSPLDEDLDLSFDLDEIDADIAAQEAELEATDLSQGFQCPSIDNEVVDELTELRVARVQEGADGCVFYFETFEFDPLIIDTYTQENFVSQAQASADLLAASTGGRETSVPNALSAYVFDDGFGRENLPAIEGESLPPGRQVLGYFMGTRGVRLVAVFPDAIVGIYDGSDTGLDGPARVALFEQLASRTVFAGG